MYCDKKTGRYGIIDGQHRAGALLIMAQQGHWNEYERNILVDVFVTQSEKQISELFREINSAEPVRLVDMPDEEGMEQNSKEMLDEATDHLMKQYPEMFKASARCCPSIIPYFPVFLSQYIEITPGNEKLFFCIFDAAILAHL